MATTVHYAAPLVQKGAFRSSVAINESQLIWDSINCCEVVDDNLTTPPGGLTGSDQGKVWILAGAGTGAWAGFAADSFAIYLYGGWLNKTPSKGQLVRNNEGAGSWLKWNGTSWTTAAI